MMHLFLRVTGKLLGLSVVVMLVPFLIGAATSRCEAQAVVLTHSDAGTSPRSGDFKSPGQLFPARGQKVSALLGDRIVEIVGPNGLTVENGSRGEDLKRAAQGLKAALERVRIRKVVRGGGAETLPPSLWQLNVTIGGTHCFRDGQPPVIWRPNAASRIELQISDIQDDWALWARDGAQYGMPKDWDTVAIVYNKAMLAEAGLTPEDLANLTWNPQDGGSFQETIARLTVDAKGKRGGDEGFDPENVTVFGLVPGPISPFGQTEWSYLAASTGFEYIDAPWGTVYKLDDPRLAETFTWLRDLGFAKGFAPTAEQTGRLGAATLLASGKGAMTVDGSWMIRSYLDTTPFEVGFAPVPAGPEGRRSMFNGLADSIWAGSPNPDTAWEWVKFLGSSECQTIVGKGGVVFPARPEAVEAAVAAHTANGLDVSAFTDLATPETTFPWPMTDYGAEIFSILQGAIDRVMLNQGDPAEILESANDEVNNLF